MLKFTVCILLHCSFLTAFTQIPDSGLVAWYPFSGNTLDSSGLGNHAVAAGGIFDIDRFDHAGSALMLDAISDSLVMPLPGYTPINGDFTISFWIKTSSPEAMNIFSLKEFPDDTVQNFEVQFSSTSRLQSVLELYYASFTYWNGSGWSGSNLGEGAPGNYHDGRWHHFLVRRKADTIQFWHNLALATPSTADYFYAGPLGEAVALVTGALPHRFQGVIDDIVIYDRAVSTPEMKQLYHDQRPFIFISPRSTDAYVQGDTATIWWLWDDQVIGDSILLEYRINGGNWMLTGQNQLVDWTPYYLPLSYPPGTTVEVRITDVLNPSLTESTGTFHVSEYNWENVSQNLPFTSRDGSGLLSFAGRMWLLGGWDPPYHYPSYTHSEVWSSADGANWNFETTAPWPARHCSGWLVHDNAMWVIGGDPQSGYLRDVWKSEDGINWIQVLDTIPGFSPPRSMHMVASFNDRLYNFGGQQESYGPECLDQVWESADGYTWNQLAAAPWNPRSMVINSCVDENDTLWLLGGGRLWDRRCFNDVWKTGDGINWELVNAAAPWPSRYWHNVAWFDHKMWVICGMVNQTNNNESWYSANGTDWYELKNPRYAERHAASVTVHNNYLWLMAGIISNDSWRLRNTTIAVAQEDLSVRSPIHLFPNPSDGIFQVAKDASFARYVIYNLMGQKIQEAGLDVTKSRETISIKAPNGTYFISLIRNDGSSVSLKLPVQ